VEIEKFNLRVSNNRYLANLAILPFLLNDPILCFDLGDVVEFVEYIVSWVCPLVNNITGASNLTEPKLFIG